VKRGCLQIYVHWQEILVVGMQQADKTTQHASDSAAICYE